MHKDAYAEAPSKFSSTAARTPASESPENTAEKPRYPFLSYFSILLSSSQSLSLKQKLFQKKNFPMPQLSTKALGKFLKAGRHASLFLHTFPILRGRRENPYSFFTASSFLECQKRSDPDKKPNSSHSHEGTPLFFFIFFRNGALCQEKKGANTHDEKGE
ncbi:hypothetical protein AVEN_259385-1 [Araneus ventricosus]|uniref:Uncharacterized protein n=1 Tax=Araneus ventricosus TaxID=182803 RepID=A0A4Y2DUJ0_ARAVE|nr:hypothetical protein AVEN_259385-1 [Araneus ventricosus]